LLGSLQQNHFGLENEDNHVPPRTTTYSFSKVLTPSDTSTHGGFSIPKRHADECFRPLVGILNICHLFSFFFLRNLAYLRFLSLWYYRTWLIKRLHRKLLRRTCTGTSGIFDTYSVVCLDYFYFVKYFRFSCNNVGKLLLMPSKINRIFFCKKCWFSFWVGFFFKWNAGQPKRHLLTSGWSTFVSAKKLVAGDSCIFVRYSLSPCLLLSPMNSVCAIPEKLWLGSQVFFFFFYCFKRS